MKSFITSIGALLLCAGTRITSVLPSTSTSISSLTVVPSSVKRSANSSICVLTKSKQQKMMRRFSAWASKEAMTSTTDGKKRKK